MTKSKLVSKTHYDYDCNVQSPLQQDVVRKVQYDEKGNEYVVYVPFDYAEFQKSLGSVDNWSLTTLLKAGIDPAFPIHTGYNTRLEGVVDVQAMESVADSILTEDNNNEENKNV